MLALNEWTCHFELLPLLFEPLPPPRRNHRRHRRRCRRHALPAGMVGAIRRVLLRLLRLNRGILIVVIVSVVGVGVIVLHFLLVWQEPPSGSSSDINSTSINIDIGSVNIGSIIPRGAQRSWQPRGPNVDTFVVDSARQDTVAATEATSAEGASSERQWRTL